MDEIAYDTCTRVSTVPVVSVSRLSRKLSKFSVRTTKRVRSNVVKDHFDRSRYFSVWWGKIRPWKTFLWELAPYDCSLQDTEDFAAWCKLVP